MAGKTTFKKIQGKLKKGLPKKIKARISEQISEQINSKLATQLASQISEKAQTVKATAQMSAHIAAETAKHSIDQVLINLEHRGIKIKETQDFANQIAMKVLERAEAIRAQIAENPMTPAWIKDVSLTPKAKASTTEAAVEAPVTSVETLNEDSIAAGSVTESTVSVAAEGMQPEAMKDIIAEEPEATELALDAETDEESETTPTKSARKRSSKSTTGARAGK